MRKNPSSEVVIKSIIISFAYFSVIMITLAYLFEILLACWQHQKYALIYV